MTTNQNEVVIPHENVQIQGLEKDLIPVKELLESVLNKYNIREGVTLKVTNSNVMAIIDVEQLRQD